MPTKPPRESGEANSAAALRAVRERRAAALDGERTAIVEKRHAQGRLTARENIDAFLDPDSFVEYGRVAKPARDDMAGAADGVVIGHGLAHGRPVAVLAYDYTVHAGTQGFVNHLKTDRIAALAAAQRWPLIAWLEGGGARPHDFAVSMRGDTRTFVNFARLSGLVPTIGIVAGRCFAGNANLAGLCDILIATESAVMGMAGPALVQQALGFTPKPEEIGPLNVHIESGAVDVDVADERAAAALARRAIGYFFGRGAPGRAPDTTRLRAIVPADPMQAYNVRRVLEHLADLDSILELRPRFGGAAVTALARLGGTPVGIVASQPAFLGGAIDSPTSDKIARFIQLCDAHDLPMVLLVDTPGLMVGPAVEKTALVRHSARILVALANAGVPFLTVVMRKAYGLGYYVLGSKALDPALLIAWPTAEFGGMGLEGAAAIIWKKEIEALADAGERKRLLREKTEHLTRKNSALEVGGRFEYDDVVDPAETRDCLIKTLRALPPPRPRDGRKRIVDCW